MAIDPVKLNAFADALKDEAARRGGWNWDAVQEIAHLAAEALGFTGDELGQLMRSTPVGTTRVLERHPISSQFTGVGGGPPQPGTFVPPKEVHDEAGDDITLARDHGLDDATVHIVQGAILFTATHLYNDDNAVVEDLGDAWKLVEKGLALGTASSPSP